MLFVDKDGRWSVKRRIYISGRMTGIPEYNYPAFNKAAAEWRAVGWEVDNPAEAFGGDTNKTMLEYATRDVDGLRKADAIAMLPGWDDKEARGSVWEYVIATRLLGLKVYDATKPTPFNRDSYPTFVSR